MRKIVSLMFVISAVLVSLSLASVNQDISSNEELSTSTPGSQESSSNDSSSQESSSNDSSSQDSSSNDSSSQDSSSNDSSSQDSSSQDSSSNDSSSQDSSSNDSSNNNDDELGLILTEKDLECGEKTATFTGCMRNQHRYGEQMSQTQRKEYNYWMGMKPCIAKCVQKHGACHKSKNNMSSKMKNCQKECVCPDQTHKKNNHKYRPSKGGGKKK